MHITVSHLSALKVKGHLQTSEVNQAANNKSASFNKQIHSQLWNSTFKIQLTGVSSYAYHRERCVVLLRDGTSYSCQAKVEQFLGSLKGGKKI